MLKLTIQSVILALVVIFGLKAYAAAAAKHEYSGIVITNINALSEPTVPGEGGEGGGVTPTDPESGTGTGTCSGTGLIPPDPWNYVPNRYLVPKVTEHLIMSSPEGGITINGLSISGTFKKGVTYKVVICTLSCDGEQQGSWCDQLRIGSTVVSTTEIEKM